MRAVLNVVWLVLAGLWLALGYLIAAALMAITIIGLPFAKQALKLAHYALWPFGRTLLPSETRNRGVSVAANVLWFVLVGWWLALEHLFAGILLCVTIVGIPLGVAGFTMRGAAVLPFGKEVVTLSAVTRRRSDASVVSRS